MVCCQKYYSALCIDLSRSLTSLGAFSIYTVVFCKTKQKKNQEKSIVLKALVWELMRIERPNLAPRVTVKNKTKQNQTKSYRGQSIYLPERLTGLAAQFSSLYDVVCSKKKYYLGVQCIDLT